MSLIARFTVERESFSLDVDLEVPSRSVLGVIGDNGSGKSTALDVIAGLLPCTTGSVVLDDSVVDEATTGVFVQPELRGIATVFQGGGLFPHLSVERNIAFGRGQSLRGTARFTDIVEAFDLSGLLKRRPSELSGGQRQRVALARAFLSPSRALLLDEPTTFLDDESRRALHRVLRESLVDYEGVVVMVSHDRDEIDAITTMVARSRVASESPTRAVLSLDVRGG